MTAYKQYKQYKQKLSPCPLKWLNGLVHAHIYGYLEHKTDTDTDSVISIISLTCRIDVNIRQKTYSQSIQVIYNGPKI